MNHSQRWLERKYGKALTFWGVLPLAYYSDALKQNSLQNSSRCSETIASLYRRAMRLSQKSAAVVKMSLNIPFQSFSPLDADLQVIYGTLMVDG